MLLRKTEITHAMNLRMFFVVQRLGYSWALFPLFYLYLTCTCIDLESRAVSAWKAGFRCNFLGGLPISESELGSFALIFARWLNLNHKKRRPSEMTTLAGLPLAVMNDLAVLV